MGTKRALLGVYNAGKSVAGWTGVPSLVWRWAGRRRVAILTYHHPTPETFEAHLRWLSRAATPIPFDRFARDGEDCPPRAVLVTIDDGEREVGALLPLIEQHRVPVMIYLTAAIVGTHRRHWWSPVIEAGDDPQPLKRLPYAEFTETLRRTYGYEFDREYPERSALSWEEIRAMQRTGLVAFGSHTLTHPILTRCPEDVARREIAESRALLEERLQAPVAHFAYPNGSHGAREIALAREAGYETARGMAAGWGDARRPFSLEVIRAADDDNPGQLAFALAGFDLARKRLTGRRG